MIISILSNPDGACCSLPVAVRRVLGSSVVGCSPCYLLLLALLFHDPLSLLALLLLPIQGARGRSVCCPCGSFVLPSVRVSVSVSIFAYE